MNDSCVSRYFRLSVVEIARLDVSTSERNDLDE